MYQIFVVEDELLIRQSIRNAIEQMQGPYAFCGEASDGEMALSIMQDLMPDILLTDIRMPFLDGFELIRYAKEMMPWLKTVIISGFDDFQFAQKAISLGVDRYLLKPVRPAELKKTIEEIAARIEKEKTERGFAADSQLSRNDVSTALRQHFMRQLLFGGGNTAALIEQARALNIDMIRAHYLVTVCYFDDPDPDIPRLRSTVNDSLASEKEILFDFTAADQMTLLCWDNDAETLNERVYRLVNILQHELKEICPVITTVVGSAVDRLGGISDAYKTAANLLKRVSAVAAGQVVNAGDTAQITADIVKYSGPFGEDFQDKLLRSGVQDVPALVDEELSSPEGEQFDSMLTRYYALINLMRMAVQIITRNTPGAQEKDIAAKLSETHDIFVSSGSRATFRQTATELLSSALMSRHEAPSEMKYSHVISRAEQYVKENFCDPDISLISVARYVGMSAAHFSTVFSQTTGRPFISYLTNLRVERAKELLRDTAMRLSDIAMEIGYNEPNYFSHVFRKTEGMTPKEYRQREGRQ